MKIKQFKNIKEMQKALAKSSAGDRVVVPIPKEGIKVRFLAEPEKWVHIYEHYTGNGFEICRDDCEICADGGRPTQRMIAAAVDVEKKRVIALKLPITAARVLLKRYDRNTTVMDRDWDLSKTGTGLETEYDVDSDGKSKFDYSKYESLDLMAVIKAEYATDDDEDEDDGEEETNENAEASDDADEDADTPDDEDDDDTPPWESKPAKKKLGKKLGK